MTARVSWRCSAVLSEIARRVGKIPNGIVREVEYLSGHLHPMDIEDVADTLAGAILYQRRWRAR